MDDCLYTTKGPRVPTVLWRPGNGRSVAKDAKSYRSFSHVVRTVHVHQALDVCRRQRMCPRSITSCSSISQKALPRGHPCRSLQVLWFGTKNSQEDDEDKHDWYGNVQFALPAKLLLERWQFFFLVEMMTAPTHTATRILVTNTDYSEVLPLYDPYKDSGSWKVCSNGNLELSDCRRYNNKGTNMHGHTLEFMLDVTPDDQKQILDLCELSFRNHCEAVDKSQPHVCHLFQNLPEPCPTPIDPASASRLFFQEHQSLCRHSPIAKPELSNSAKHYLRCYLKMDTIPETPRRALLPCPLPVFWVPLMTQVLPPTFYINQQTCQYMMGLPQGIMYAHTQFIICGFDPRIPEFVMQSKNLHYIPWNYYYINFWAELQKQNQDYVQKNYPRISQCPDDINQCHAIQFEHSTCTKQSTNVQQPEPIQHIRNHTPYPAFQHNNDAIHLIKLQQTWHKERPTVLQQYLSPFPSSPLNVGLEKRIA